MNKILMVVYSWPPRAGVGMLRPLKFAKYLPKFGWEPTILTPENAPSQIYCSEKNGYLQGVKIAKTGYSDILNKFKGIIYKKRNTLRVAIGRSKSKHVSTFFIKNQIREVLTIPDECNGWYKKAVEKGREVLSKEKFDLILSTSPPEISHLIAKRLKGFAKIPWVADLRDLWSEDHYRAWPWYKRFILSILERKTLCYADKIITVSPQWKSILYKKYGNKVDFITNGYDEKDFNNLVNGQFNPSKKLILSYTGKLHPKYQNLGILIQSINELINKNLIKKDDIELRFFTLGFEQPDFEDLAKRYNFQKDRIIRVFSPISYKDSIQALRYSNVLLLFQWEGRMGNGHLPAKLFDYLGAKRPILTISSRKNSDLCKIIRETNTGCICSSKDELKQALLDYYSAFKENKLHYNPNEKIINKYSCLNLTEQFVGILNKCKK